MQLLEKVLFGPLENITVGDGPDGGWINIFKLAEAYGVVNGIVLGTFGTTFPKLYTTDHFLSDIVKNCTKTAARMSLIGFAAQKGISQDPYMETYGLQKAADFSYLDPADERQNVYFHINDLRRFNLFQEKTKGGMSERIQLVLGRICFSGMLKLLKDQIEPWVKANLIPQSRSELLAAGLEPGLPSNRKDFVIGLEHAWIDGNQQGMQIVVAMAKKAPIRRPPGYNL